MWPNSSACSVYPFDSAQRIRSFRSWKPTTPFFLQPRQNSMSDCLNLSFAILSLCFSLTITHLNSPFRVVNNDCVEVDELILEIADYTNDYSKMVAEKLLRKCSTSWEAYQYLRDRVHDGWLPDRARQLLRRIIKRIQVQIQQSREYGWAYEYS